MVDILPYQELSCYTSVPRQSHPPRTREQGDANASYNSSDSDDNAQDDDDDDDNDNDDDDDNDQRSSSEVCCYNTEWDEMTL